MKKVLYTGYERINAVIEKLYGAALNPELFPQALDEMASIYGSPGAALFPLEAGIPVMSYASNEIMEGCLSYFNEWVHRCPRVAYDAKFPIFNRCFWDGDILDEEILNTDPYYQEYGPFFGVRYSVVRCTTAIVDGARYGISSPFSLKTGVPSDEQLRLFELVSGHATKALAIYQQLRQTEGAFQDMAQLLDRRGCGIILVDAKGDVVFMNDVAAELQGDGFSVSNKRLVASSNSHQYLVDRMLAAAFDAEIREPTLRPIALPRPSLRRMLQMDALPLHAGKELSFMPLATSVRGVLITVSDPAATAPRIGIEPLTALGLTKSEAQVAARLGSGMELKMVADELQISIGTARNHLKSVYSKLGIGKQAQLVAFVSRLFV